jgi:U1 small nuclear ribonucleoprotein
MKSWNPFEGEDMTEDPYKTLIISRIAHSLTEKKLKKEFEIYGPVKYAKIIRNKYNDKPRGFAFVEFEHKSDFKTAYKHSDGRKIEGRRFCIDFERGRTVLNWRPRKFGGGIGDTRKGKTPSPSKSRSVSRDKSPRRKKKRSRSRSHSHERKRKHVSRSRSRSRSHKKHKKKDKKNKKKEKRDSHYDD